MVGQSLIGPGISQRAAAARTQRLWRWLVNLWSGQVYSLESSAGHKLQAASLTGDPG